MVFGVTALMGGAAVDQPGLEVRALRPVQGDGRLPARLVHGLARRRAADHAQLGDPHLGPHDLLERADPRSRSCCRSCCSAIVCCCRSSRRGSPATSASTTCSSGPRNAPTRTAFLAALMTVYGLLWAAGGNDIIATQLHTEPELDHLLHAGRGLHRARRSCSASPGAGASGCSAPTTTGCCTATRPASSCGRPRAATPSGTCRSARTRAYTLTARDRDEVHAPSPTTDDERRGRPRHPRRAAPGPAVARRCTPTTCRSRPPRSSRRRTTTPSTSHELEAGLDHPAAGHEFDDHALRDADDVPAALPLSSRARQARDPAGIVSGGPFCSSTDAEPVAEPVVQSPLTLISCRSICRTSTRSAASAITRRCACRRPGCSSMNASGVPELDARHPRVAGRR